MMKINDLAKFRFFITKSKNANWGSVGSAGSARLAMATTYENLKKTYLKTADGSHLLQADRNKLVALNAFLQTVQKNQSSPIGTELTEDFDACVKRHLEASSLGDKSKTDRRSLLNGWRNAFLERGEAPVTERSRERSPGAAAPAEQNLFEKTLWDALKRAKLAPKTAARAAGISPVTLRRWTRGALPNGRTTCNFDGLESVLKLTPGTLNHAFRQATGRGDEQPKNAFRVRQKERTQNGYTLKEAEVTPALMQEWYTYFSYKIAKSARSLRRGKKGRWTTVELTESTIQPTAMNSRGLEISATADITWQHTSRFLGFLRLPLTQGGYGLSNEQSQTIAWLAVPEAIEAYMKFMQRRSDGVAHTGHRVFAAIIMSLTHPVTGFLTQSSSFSDGLPSLAIDGRSWEQLCKETWETASIWKSDSNGISREPVEPIQFLLDQNEPAQPIFVAMRRLKRIGDRETAGSLREAIARRDELLLGFIISNPLRAKNLIMLKYKRDNTANIYKASNGQWRLRLAGSDFKNRARVGRDKYDVAIASWLQDHVENYVSTFRPVLKKTDELDYFFLGSRGGGAFRALNRHVFDLTRRYISGCSGFGTHAFRHLVATDWLTKNPNDFLTVAELLNDTLEVVMSNYAHLKKDSAFERYEGHLQRSLL